MRHLTLFCLTLTLFAAPVHAQPDSLWSRTYGGHSGDLCYSLVQTADGGFALAGTTYSFGAGDADFWLVRTDENGDTLWTNTYGGQERDDCTSAIQTSDGGFVLAGFTESFGTGWRDFWLVRTDENGDSLWSRTYGGEDYEWCYSIVQIADGGFALAGSSISFGEGDLDFWLLRTDENCDSLWSHSYGRSQCNDECFSIVQTSDGGFALAGRTQYFGTDNVNFWLVRTDESGDSLWSQTYGGHRRDYCQSLVQTADGGYALAGSTSSFGAGWYDFWLVRTNENGDSLWSQTYGGQSCEECNSLVQTEDGGYALAGWARNSVDGWDDFRLARTDENGACLWSRTLGGQYNNYCQSLIQTADLGYALAGLTFPSAQGHCVAWLVRLGPENSVTSDEATAPVRFGLDAVYPNPFNSTAVASYKLQVTSRIELRLYDLSGRLVQTLVDGWQEAGEHQAVIDGTSLPSGIYLVKLTDGRESAVMKAALLK